MQRPCREGSEQKQQRNRPLIGEVGVLMLDASFKHRTLIEKVRKVRTLEGSKFFGLPIGTPITRANIEAARAKHGAAKTDARLEGEKSSNIKAARAAARGRDAEIDLFLRREKNIKRREEERRAAEEARLAPKREEHAAIYRARIDESEDLQEAERVSLIDPAEWSKADLEAAKDQAFGLSRMKNPLFRDLQDTLERGIASHETKAEEKKPRSRKVSPPKKKKASVIPVVSDEPEAPAADEDNDEPSLEDLERIESGDDLDDDFDFTPKKKPERKRPTPIRINLDEVDNSADINAADALLSKPFNDWTDEDLASVKGFQMRLGRLPGGGKDYDTLFRDLMRKRSVWLRKREIAINAGLDPDKWESSSKSSIAKVRRVRTAEGSRYYNAPIGTPITEGMRLAAKARKASEKVKQSADKSKKPQASAARSNASAKTKSKSKSTGTKAPKAKGPNDHKHKDFIEQAIKNGSEFDVYVRANGSQFGKHPQPGGPWKVTGGSRNGYVRVVNSDGVGIDVEFEGLKARKGADANPAPKAQSKKPDVKPDAKGTDSKPSAAKRLRGFQDRADKIPPAGKSGAKKRDQAFDDLITEIVESDEDDPFDTDDYHNILDYIEARYNGEDVKAVIEPNPDEEDVDLGNEIKDFYDKSVKEIESAESEEEIEEALDRFRETIGKNDYRGGWNNRSNRYQQIINEGDTRMTNALRDKRKALRDNPPPFKRTNQDDLDAVDALDSHFSGDGRISDAPSLGLISYMREHPERFEFKSLVEDTMDRHDAPTAGVSAIEVLTDTQTGEKYYIKYAVGYDLYDDYMKEEITSEVLRALGLSTRKSNIHIPLTQERDGSLDSSNKKAFIVQDAVSGEGYDDSHELVDLGTLSRSNQIGEIVKDADDLNKGIGMDEAGKQGLLDMYIFDYIVGNTRDRHVENVFFARQGKTLKPLILDHGLAFGTACGTGAEVFEDPNMSFGEWETIYRGNGLNNSGWNMASYLDRLYDADDLIDDSYETMERLAKKLDLYSLEKTLRKRFASLSDTDMEKFDSYINFMRSRIDALLSELEGSDDDYEY